MKPLQSLDEVDPELLRDVREARHPAQRAEVPLRRGGRRDLRLGQRRHDDEGGARGSTGSSSARSARRCASIPSSCRSTSAPSCRTRDNFFAALNAAVFSDGSFVYVPKGVRCPMELSTYFRINAEGTGQFERTLIIADEGVVRELPRGVHGAEALDEPAARRGGRARRARRMRRSSTRRCRTGMPATRKGKGGIYNFVTKRGKCAGANSKISWTQVETGSAITWKYPSVILQGDNSTGEFYSRGRREQPASRPTRARR